MIFQRHDLVWLSADGDYPQLLASWVAQGYPCVIPRQDLVLTGLLKVARSLPLDKSPSGRFAFLISPKWVINHQRALPIEYLSHLFAVNELSIVFEMLHNLNISARFYGSCAWQVLCKQIYIHESSDVDILLSVESEQQLVKLPELLQFFEKIINRRIDGEIVFPDNSAVAWREWFSDTEQLLVKTVADVKIVERKILLDKLK